MKKHQAKIIGSGKWAYGNFLEKEGKAFIVCASTHERLEVESDTVVKLLARLQKNNRFNPKKYIFENDIVHFKNQSYIAEHLNKDLFTLKNQNESIKISKNSTSELALKKIESVFDFPDLEPTRWEKIYEIAQKQHAEKIFPTEKMKRWVEIQLNNFQHNRLSQGQILKLKQVNYHTPKEVVASQLADSKESERRALCL